MSLTQAITHGFWTPKNETVRAHGWFCACFWALWSPTLGGGSQTEEFKTKRDSEAQYCKFCNLGQYLSDLQRFATTAESTPRLTGIPGPRSGGAILLAGWEGKRQGAASDKGIDMQEMNGRFLRDARSISTRWTAHVSQDIILKTNRIRLWNRIDVQEMVGGILRDARSIFFKHKHLVFVVAFA